MKARKLFKILEQIGTGTKAPPELHERIMISAQETGSLKKATAPINLLTNNTQAWNAFVRDHNSWLEVSKFSTKEAVAQLKRRDYGTWEDFYNVVWEPLCEFIGTKLANSPHSQEDIEDIARETITQAYAIINQFRDDCFISTFIKNIAWQVTVNFLRKLAILNKSAHNNRIVIKFIRSVVFPDSLDIHLEEQNLDFDLWKKMKEITDEVLQEKFSLLIAMHYEEALTAQQIADQLGGGVAIGIVNSWIMRAVLKLREHRARFLQAI
jgi:DNA-directed RNA polymerase specialized sigma24 family protein